MLSRVHCAPNNLGSCCLPSQRECEATDWTAVSGWEIRPEERGEEESRGSADQAAGLCSVAEKGLDLLSLRLNWQFALRFALRSPLCLRAGGVTGVFNVLTC